METNKLYILHEHNSIPNYFDNLDEGCETCIHNNYIRTAIKITEEEVWAEAAEEIEGLKELVKEARQLWSKELLKKLPKPPEISTIPVEHSATFLGGYDACLQIIKDLINDK